MGRTGRRRKKRQKERSSRSLSHLEPYVNLAQWMRKQGFVGAPLCPTTFVGTGRGLAATKTIKVSAGYNEQRGCYEVRTLSPCERWKQAFIAYGDHSNYHLLLEYGFVTSPNPYSLLPLHAEDELAVFVANQLEKSLQKNLVMVVERGLDRDMTIGARGLSWNLQVVLRALALKPHNRMSFGDVVVGHSVPTSMQAMVTKLAFQLCEQLVDDRRRRLAKVSHVEWRSEATSMVITLLTEELEILQQCLSLINVGAQDSL
uniref:SET domain-containing protein 4 isoform X4 n=1 Tax=Myxine glutinosa TaxID=7769 RepID=UPI0035900FEC